MSRMLTFMQQLRRDEEGAALVEYTVLLGIILVAVILAVTAVGQWVGGRWTGLCTSLNTSGVGTCNATAGTGT
jgi:pilus assembly protein Flp/PilA